MGPKLDRLFVEFAANKLNQLASRIDDCVARLSEDQIWARGAESENAIGNLILHLNGNVRQWILAGVGGQPDFRQRDKEFAARGGASRERLLRDLRVTLDEAVAVIGDLSTIRLAESVRVQDYTVTVLEAVFHVVEHFAQHTGQIIYATKMLTGEDPGYYRHLSRPHHDEQTP
jgi:uncharacterized damage-inducible protein DinB